MGNGWTISHQPGFRKKNYRTKAVGGSEYSQYMKRQVLQTNDMHTIGNWLDFIRHVLQVGSILDRP